MEQITTEYLTHLYSELQDCKQPVVTQQQLESHLWEAANILRGSIDSSDYKIYIFGMLFLKRMSDVFVEEAARIYAETGDTHLALHDPAAHQFFVPADALWSGLQQYRTMVGKQLNSIFSAIEQANRDKMEGVLETIDFDVKSLTDGTLTQLILHFEKLTLGNSNLEKPDILGAAYEYLVAQFADDAGKKGGEYYTPHKVVQLLVELLDPQEGMMISDPTCGSGGMLIECAKHVEQSGGGARRLTLHGQEKNMNTWAICKLNLLLHGLLDHQIELGDTIRTPKLVEADRLKQYDLVIANPPFSLKNWGLEEAKADRYGRFVYGLPSNSYGDYAFVQHMVASLNPHGKLAVVMPNGVLFRGGQEHPIRRELLEADLFEAVIALPPNLFFGTGIPASILVLSKNKPVERREKVLLIQATNGFQARKNQNFLREEDLQNIVGAYREFQDLPGYCKVAALDDIRKQDYNLNISRYVDSGGQGGRVDLEQAIKSLRQLEAERDEATAAMYSYLKELGL
ncbi:type I restriction endonuclease subunit M [Tumebacillus avium]|uniref:site-specific DNA-methyltransferase (adenine-specific) n=1 Tax=Tumebacillus avium TaxID=1903704 RepID=A0A1Y0ITL2_9BACL|nr:class I SAM-dependent DNA methyltransferase [Tumebacillus avium]ARU62733.1 type I restriction endonuclease subunit M [Tumebacillus avium]